MCSPSPDHLLCAGPVLTPDDLARDKADDGTVMEQVRPGVNQEVTSLRTRGNPRVDELWVLHGECENCMVSYREVTDQIHM